MVTNEFIKGNCVLLLHEVCLYSYNIMVILLFWMFLFFRSHGVEVYIERFKVENG